VLDFYHGNQGITVLTDDTKLLSQKLVSDSAVDTEQRMRWVEQRAHELERRSCLEQERMATSTGSRARFRLGDWQFRIMGAGLP